MGFEQWLSDPSKVGATILLMGGIYAYHKGWIVARWNFDLIVTQLQSELTRMDAQCKTEREARERILNQLERTVNVAQTSTETAAKAVSKQ